MPGSDQAVQFEMCSGNGSQPSPSVAVLTVTHQRNYKGLGGWKAVINQGESKRIFGVPRATIVDAVEVLLRKQGHRISETEVHRLLQVAAAMQARRTANDCTSGIGSQPSNASEPVTPPLSQAHRRENGVLTATLPAEFFVLPVEWVNVPQSVWPTRQLRYCGVD